MNQNLCKNLTVFAFSKYYYLTDVIKVPQSSTETIYDLNSTTKSVSTTATYAYNSLGQVSSISQTQSDGSTITTLNKYPSDYGPITNFICPKADDQMTSALEKMISNNILNIPIESFTAKDGNIIGGQLNTFRYDYDNSIVLPDNQYKLYIQSPLNYANFTQSYIERQSILWGSTTCDKLFHLDSRYQPVISYDSYDSQGDLLQYHKTNDINTSYIWGYNKTQPIAEVKNAKADEIYFNSYEEGTGLFTTDAHTGNSCVSINTSNQFAGDAVFSKSSLTNGKYVYSAWFKTSGTATMVVKDKIDQVPWIPMGIGNTNGVWKYYEMVVDLNSSDFNGCSQVGIEIYNSNSTPVLVDDVRFRPLNSQMSTYTYKPLVGVTSVTDNRNKITTYEYDGLGRLQLTKDESGNILNYYNYKYSSEPDPLASCSLSKSLISGCSYRFTISGANFDPTNYTYDWDFGDGTSQAGVIYSSCYHSYSDFGFYTVTVNIRYEGVVVKTLTISAECVDSGGSGGLEQ